MSSPNRQVVLSPEAQDDFANIIAYTGEQWDERQQDIYADRIMAVLSLLAEMPAVGRPRDIISPGLRSHPFDSYVVFYRVGDRTIDIVRILHGRMNASAAFDRP